jgi:TPR repeat protein
MNLDNRSDFDERRRRLSTLKDEAKEFLKQLEGIENKNAEEWCAIGLLYQHSFAVEKDLDRAKLCFLEAATLGNSKAMMQLGLIARRQETPEAYSASINWYRQAAELNNANAMIWLGFAYRGGEGVEQDYELSAKWFKKAIDHGALCYEYLGSLYSHYRKMPEEGLKWYLLGEKEAKGNYYAIARIYETRDTPCHDPKKAEEYYLKRIAERSQSDFNSCSGILELAELYLTGAVCADGLNKAKTWLHKILDKEKPSSSKYKQATKLLSKMDDFLL